MYSQDDDSQQGLVLGVLFGVIALVVTLVVGVGLYKSNQSQRPDHSAPVTAAVVKLATERPEADRETPLDVARAVQAASDAAGIQVENGVVKFYFASGQADLAAGAGGALVDLIKEAKAGRKLVISGFHDASGDAGKNAELARQRALAVRDALRAAGVTQQQIVLRKPEPMATTSSSAEARRVEVNLQ